MSFLHVGRIVSGLACLAVIGVFGGPAQGGEKKDVLQPGILEGVPFCTIPNIDRGKLGVDVRTSHIINEIEPNETIAQANVIPLSESNPSVDVLGNNSGNEDDYFAVTLNKGDILGVAVLRASGNLDPMVAVYKPDQTILLRNDDGSGGIYPSINPLPRNVLNTDSATSIIAPVTGTYYLQVHPFVDGLGGFSDGDYVLQARWFRNVYESMPVSSRQTIWVDFSGPTINGAALFGGNASANLSPLRDFLPAWGLTAGNESALILAIVAVMAEDFDALAAENPGFDYIMLNSLQHTLPPGTPNVTKIIIGGTIAELGVSTIGIAESIDPGNFNTNETGVILLDLLSAPAPNGNSANSITFAGGVSKITTVAEAVGTVASHEAGHVLGNWHTDRLSPTSSVMNQGGNHIRETAGVGPDQILGTADDVEVPFAVDRYASEGVAQSPLSIEHTNIRTAFAMSKPVCAVNLNGDNAVDGADLGLLLGAWGTAGSPADFNNDGTVDGADLGLLLGGWGPC